MCVCVCVCVCVCSNNFLVNAGVLAYVSIKIELNQYDTDCKRESKESVLSTCFDDNIDDNYHHHHHHHHHVVLVARISQTLSRHFSLSFIASGRSSGQWRFWWFNIKHIASFDDLISKHFWNLVVGFFLNPYIWYSFTSRRFCKGRIPNFKTPKSVLNIIVRYWFFSLEVSYQLLQKFDILVWNNPSKLSISHYLYYI